MATSAVLRPVVLSSTTTHSAWQNALRALVVLLGACLVAQIALAYYAIGQDQTWLLYAAQQMAHGVQLYGPQLTETNPPLIIWLSAFPVELARITHASLPAAFSFTVLLAVFASAAWCYRLLGAAVLPLSRAQRLLFAFAIFYIESNLEPGALGQREHLLVLLVIPYLIAFAMPRRTPLSPVETSALALAAAAGICIKPQQAVMLLGFQCAVVIAHRTWRRLAHPVNLSIAVTLATFAAYGAAVLLFAPLYVRSEMPLLVKTYWAFGTYTYAQLAVMDRHFLAFFAVGTALLLLARKRGVPQTERTYVPAAFLLASALSLVAFMLQHTGFTYQHIPQDLFAQLAILWLLIEFSVSAFPAIPQAFALSRRHGFALAAIALALTAAGARHRSATFAPAPSSAAAGLRGFYAQLPAGTPVFALSTNPQAGFPYVVQDHLVWASRFAHLWMMPAVEQNTFAAAHGLHATKTLSPADQTRIATLQRDQVAEDLRTRKPQFVLVPHCYEAFDCEAIRETHFDTLAWFAPSANFRAAWAPYRKQQTLPDAQGRPAWDVYRLQS
jgi:hypothetical protein